MGLLRHVSQYGPLTVLTMNKHLQAFLDKVRAAPVAVGTALEGQHMGEAARCGCLSLARLPLNAGIWGKRGFDGEEGRCS